MKRYQCPICGEVYDPEVGDYDGAIEPGVPFEALPDVWGCPQCGAPREDFVELEDLPRAVVHEDSPDSSVLTTKFAQLLSGTTRQ